MAREMTIDRFRPDPYIRSPVMLMLAGSRTSTALASLLPAAERLVAVQVLPVLGDAA